MAGITISGEVSQGIVTISLLQSPVEFNDQTGVPFGLVVYSTTPPKYVYTEQPEGEQK